MNLFSLRWGKYCRAKRVGSPDDVASSASAGRQTALRLLLPSFIEARYHYTQTNYDCQEYHGSYQYPSEHTEKILIAVVEDKLPKPGHFGLGHELCKHRLRSVAPL
jgi:hypothetical protein